MPLIPVLKNFVEKMILESYRSFLVYDFFLSFFTAFNILSLYLTFAIFIMVYLDVGLFGFTLFDPICVYCTLICFLLQVWKVYSYDFIKYIVFSFFFWDSYNADVGTFDFIPTISQKLFSFLN